MSETADKVIRSAERMIREGGYHSFSFRQIADELGVKSASIHYHFPSKETLGEAVTLQYSARFLEGLGDPESHESPLKFYVNSFRASLKAQGNTCLCSVLSAECGRLPKGIREALEAFTTQNLIWLEKALKIEAPDWSSKKIKDTSAVVFCAMEGAITFAALTGKESHLTQVGRALLASVE